MTTRRPGGMPYESWIDRQIREAQERGEFDNLPGAGKPIPDLHQPYDELWWIRRKLRDEGVSYLPPALQARRELERAREAVMRARSEREVRTLVAEVNEYVRQVNRLALDGPASTVMPLDEDAELARWRERQPSD